MYKGKVTGKNCQKDLSFCEWQDFRLKVLVEKIKLKNYRPKIKILEV